MIHLDANVLIRLSIPGSGAASKVRQWLAAGEMLAVSAPAWFEYISGPITAAEISRAESLLQGGIVGFEKNASHLAADLFNLTGRKRAMKLDCMIAASCLLNRVRIATTNVDDFSPFAPQGLAIEPVAL